MNESLKSPYPMKAVWNIGLCVTLIAVIAASLSLGARAAERDGNAKLKAEIRKYTSDLPFRMPEIKLPEFPDAKFDITSYGAVGDGHSMNTSAFRKAIDACSKAGGGMVVVPPGLWLTGPIELKSNVNFHVERGALILFTPDHSEYPVIKSPTRGYVVASPVYGFNLTNVAISGNGLLDGSGVAWRPVKKEKVTASMWKSFVKSGGVVTDDGRMWWPTKEAAEGEQYLRELHSRKNKSELTANDFLPARDFMRPILLLLSRCRNVLIDGVTLENSPMFAMLPDRCENVVIRDVKVNNEYWAQNGDGIDIASSKNVLVYKCTVTAGDDGICMKSSKDLSGQAALKNIVVADCVVYHAHGGFVIGSNTDGGMEDISVKDCDYVGTDIGLRFKSARGRGGLVKNVFIDNIFMKDIVNQAILFNTYYEESDRNMSVQPVTPKTPVFENFHISNIYCVGAKEAVVAAGLPEMPIRNIDLSNIYISADRGFTSDFASGFTLKNVKIVPKSGDVYSLNNTENFVLDRGFCPEDAGTFMKVMGEKTHGVEILNTDLSAAKVPVEFGAGVDQNVVKIH